MRYLFKAIACDQIFELVVQTSDGQVEWMVGVLYHIGKIGVLHHIGKTGVPHHTSASFFTKRYTLSQNPDATQILPAASLITLSTLSLSPWAILPPPKCLVFTLYLKMILYRVLTVCSDFQVLWTHLYPLSWLAQNTRTYHKIN